MSRLTERDGDSYTYSEYATSRDGSCCFGVARLKNEAIDKLGRLEDKEDRLGCPLETVLKALTQGVYAEYTVAWEPEVKKEIGKFSVCLAHNLFGLKGWFIMAGRKEIDFWKLDEYGKTWALTKEELQ